MAQKSIKRWIFSGLDSTSDEPRARKQIESLGGIVVDRDKYTFMCTHLLIKEFNATEKILAALAAGKWIVTADYLRDSYKHGCWLDEREYEVILHQKVCKYRRQHKDSTGAGIYFGWIFYICLGNKHLTRSVRRIIAAGDGEVVSETDLSKAHAIISDSEKNINANIQLSLPIISFNYLKETLIMKRDPSLIKPYMLNNHRAKTLPKRAKKLSDNPVLIIEDKGKPSTSKRPIVDLIGSPNKKQCSWGKEKGLSPAGSLKQTRLDKFLKFQKGPGVTPQFMHRGRTVSSAIEIVEICDSPVKAGLSKSRKENDCMITKVKKGPRGSMCRVSQYEDIEILEESCKTKMEPGAKVCKNKDTDYKRISAKEIQSASQGAANVNMANIQLIPGKENLLHIKGEPVSQGISEHSVKMPIVKDEPVTKFLRTLPVAGEVACTNKSVSGSIDDAFYDLPDISGLKNCTSKGEAITVKANHMVPKCDNKVNSDMSVPLKTIRSSAVLTDNEVKKLPEDVRKALSNNAMPIRYSREDMKKTVIKFIKSTKSVNRFNVSFAEHSESKLVHQGEEHIDRDNLDHLMNPTSVFQHCTSVRELTSREVAYYEASTDEDTINCKMAETEKSIIIMGIFSLQIFVTPYTYPPPNTFGHLLQKMIFEAPFQLSYTRAIDVAYSILRYFPPLNLEMRKYYIKVFESAARHEENFTDNLYLPWKFMLRSIESLQGTVSPTNDSSMSSSEGNDTLNRKANSLGLLEFILAVLSEDMKQPNHGEFVRDHLAWQVFWGQSSDPTEITSPIKLLLRLWMSLINASTRVRHCLAKLVAMVLELTWRFERSLLLPVSPMPASLHNLSDFLFNRIVGCDSKTILKLLRDLPSPWARSIFGSIIFKSETHMNNQEITFEHVLEFGFLIENQDDSKEMNAGSTNKRKQPVSPRKKLQKSVNKRGPKGETKLSEACIKGNLGKVKELLSVPGIDINLPDYNGWTPLHEAAIRGNNDCVKALLKYDCSQSLDMKNTLHLYLRRAQSYLCNVAAQAEEGRTALHDAVENNHLKTARILLDYGGDALLHIKDKAEKTPVLLCQSGEMIKLLESYRGKISSKGPQKNSQFRKSSSILHSALSNSQASLLCYEDRKQFIISFTNCYLEATGIRFCRKDMKTEAFRIYTEYLTQKHDRLPDSKRKSEVAQINKDTYLNAFGFENVKLNDVELEKFDLVYERLNHNVALCRELTGKVKGATKEPEFIIAVRKLIL